MCFARHFGLASRLLLALLLFPFPRRNRRLGGSRCGALRVDCFLQALLALPCLGHARSQLHQELLLALLLFRQQRQSRTVQSALGIQGGGVLSALLQERARRGI